MTLFQFIIALLLLKIIGIGGTCVYPSYQLRRFVSHVSSYVPSIAFFPDFTFSYETFMRTRNLGLAYVLMVSVCVWEL